MSSRTILRPDKKTIALIKQIRVANNAIYKLNYARIAFNVILRGQTNTTIMETIRLLPILHRGAEQILLQYEYSERLNHVARRIKGVKWSQSHKGWYLPLTQESYQAIQQAFGHLEIVDKDALTKYLHQRKAVQATKPVHKPVAEEPGVKPIVKNAVPVRKTPPPPPLQAAFKLAAPNLEALKKMMDQLMLKAYSESTMRTYRGEMLVFLQVLGNHAAETLTTADVKRYLLKCIAEGLSENTVHSRMNTLKFFYEQVLGREKFFVEIPRPKKPLQLPPFFNQDEIAALIRGTENRKHKTMLMLAYSAGLRVSEVVSIKVWQIDSSRMQILIQQAKGKKDRIVPLSAVLLVMLREYFTAYRPDKKGYLFSGDKAGEHYSERSLQKVLQQAKERAGVLKPGSTHALRHSFATHLLDKGTDITMIMKLLGHNDLKTTLRYLHVTNRDVLKLISPLDDLKL